MTKIPPEIARFRKPGTQIKLISGHYYLVKVTSKWDPVAKKVKKVFLGHLGTVTENGFVPKNTVRRPVGAKTYSKEFGATWAVSELTRDIHEYQKKHFPFPGLGLSSDALSVRMKQLGVLRPESE